jgi:hypothetical protein
MKTYKVMQGGAGREDVFYVVETDESGRVRQGTGRGSYTRYSSRKEADTEIGRRQQLEAEEAT